jgi:putative hydrolase of the HAD superfamily
MPRADLAQADFAHVKTWVFDLDNTLYPADIRLFDQIERRMTRYVMRTIAVDEMEADRLRRRYWEDHGTTLAGLMREHGIDPVPYLAEVHDIDLTSVAPHAALREAIGRLPGRKIVYTNGSREHARRVTGAIGLDGIFDRLYGFEDAAYIPKPQAAAFAAIFETDGLVPTRAAMFEDDHRNLAVPHALGMRTVLVGPGSTGACADHAHVHHVTDDLVAFLARIGP